MDKEAVDKDTRKLVKAAKKAGWQVSRSGSGHSRLHSPQRGQDIVERSTPGNNGAGRELRRARRRFRRHATGSPHRAVGAGDGLRIGRADPCR